MIVDFEKINEETLTNFKGGLGELLTRNYIDSDNKIMLSRLMPGASSGFHVHEGNSEIVYILNGTARFVYDDQEENVNKGEVHYCPNGHGHAMHNDTQDEITYLAIVSQH